MRRLGALGAAFALLLALSACAEEPDSTGTTEELPDLPMESDTTPATPTDIETATNGDVFNDADVRFATAMIPHHAQALDMVRLTEGRDLSPELTTLAEQIRAAQSPEIEQMSEWLTSWEQPVPGTSSGHAGHDTEMPGMMTEEQMSELESARGEDFERMWLELMIQHHQGAVEMAEEERDSGMFQPATELAHRIESSQQAEIRHMAGLLDG